VFDAKFNRLLQEIAWETVSTEPLAGIKGTGGEGE
jgi:hypothetical protein